MLIWELKMGFSFALIKLTLMLKTISKVIQIDLDFDSKNCFCVNFYSDSNFFKFILILILQFKSFKTPPLGNKT